MWRFAREKNFRSANPYCPEHHLEVNNLVSKTSFSEELLRVAHDPNTDLAEAALVLAKFEYPNLDAAPYLTQLDVMGKKVMEKLALANSPSTPVSRIKILNEFLFTDQKFRGSVTGYDDPRNSFLNDVMDRRIGIPITLAVIYIEVARRTGIEIEGINFPGRFLMRHRHGPEEFILDPFERGAILSESDCEELLRSHTSGTVHLDRSLLAPATRPQVLIRMLTNLKRVYLYLRSFPQARWATDLLLTLDPSGLVELRDRGLLAYHLNDFASALSDLETYLQLAARGKLSDEDREEYDQLWDHVKTLRRRVASFN